MVYLRNVFNRACLFVEVCSGVQGRDGDERKEPAKKHSGTFPPSSLAPPACLEGNVFELEEHHPSMFQLLFSEPRSWWKLAFHAETNAL